MAKRQTADIDVTHRVEVEVTDPLAHEKLDVIIRLLRSVRRTVIRGDQEIMADTAELEAAVEAQTEVVQAAVTAFEGVADLVADALAEAGATQEAIDAATAVINESSDALAAAIPKGTPADPDGLPDVPDNTLPGGQGGTPNQDLPGDQPHPDQGLPGDQPVINPLQK